MSTQYLLDPWFVQLKLVDAEGDRLSRLNALNKVKDLSEKLGLSPVSFIDEEFLKVFRDDFRNYQRADGHAIGSIIASLVILEPYDKEAEISDSPCPELTPSWRRALDQYGHENASPHWRRPIIVISEFRSDAWPRANEIRFKTSSDDELRKRNLVHVESYERHAYCEPDLDPWRLGAVGALTVKQRRLPRPFHLLPLHLTFDQIVQILGQKLECSCGREGKMYYIPPGDWDPRFISKERWRSEDVFPRQNVPGGQKGQRDRAGRIWLWDRLHYTHWDVQLPGGGHLNVSADGRLL